MVPKPAFHCCFQGKNNKTVLYYVQNERCTFQWAFPSLQYSYLFPGHFLSAGTHPSRVCWYLLNKNWIKCNIKVLSWRCYSVIAHSCGNNNKHNKKRRQGMQTRRKCLETLIARAHTSKDGANWGGGGGGTCLDKLSQTVNNNGLEDEIMTPVSIRQIRVYMRSKNVFFFFYYN